MLMQRYISKVGKLPATTYEEAKRLARRRFHEIENQSRRKPYIRSKYFSKQKVFLHQFWDHLNQKDRRDGFRRVVLFSAAIDLIINSRNAPEMKVNPNSKHEKLYKFSGQTNEGVIFFVQIKDSGNGRKYLMSIFPK